MNGEGKVLYKFTADKTIEFEGYVYLPAAMNEHHRKLWITDHLEDFDETDEDVSVLMTKMKPTDTGRRGVYLQGHDDIYPASIEAWAKVYEKYDGNLGAFENDKKTELEFLKKQIPLFPR